MTSDAIAARLAGLSPAKRALLERRRRGEAAAAPAVTIGRRAGAGPAPLSFAQQRLWLLDQLEPGDPAYTLRLLLRLAGPLDRRALAGSFREAVRRHEVLRTAFRAEGGEPVQVVLPPPAETGLPCLDLTALPEPVRERESLARSRELARTGFDLARPPLLRVVLIAIGARDHHLAVTLHHIAADGWSESVLVREVAALYEACAAGRPSPLPELPIQYADYAVWQRSTEVDLDAQLDWWRQELAGAPQDLALPVDRARTPAQSRAGGLAAERMPADLAAGVRELARREGATPFMVFLAAFQTVLHRWSGQEDLLVGTPVANRALPETEGLIGLFVSTIVLRGRMAPVQTFRDLLGRTRETVLGAFAHQDLPFERLVEELAPERNLAVSPLFQVLLTLQPPPAAPRSLPGLTLEPVRLHHDQTLFDLSFDLAEADGAVECTLEHSRALFDGTTAARLLASFLHLLAGAVASPERRIAELPLLSAAERHQMLREWNEPGDRQPRIVSILDLFESQVDRAPDAWALRDGARRFTYGELDRQANRVAHRLRRLGIGPEDRVAVRMERSAELLAAFLGILKAGGVYVPLDPAYPPERLAVMLEDSEALLLDDLDHLEDERSDRPERAIPSPDQLAYVIYTSGSTGRPKGVMISHRALSAFAEATLPVYGTGPGDRVLQFCSISFDTSLEEIVPCLCGGAELVVRTDAMIEVETFLAKCAEWGITVVAIPTAYWHEIAARLAGGLSLPSCLRLAVIGGERVVLEHAATWRRRTDERHRVINTYGLTESTITSTMRDLRTPSAAEARRGVSIGSVIRGTEILLLDRALELAPVGVAAEIHVGGALLARGYLGQPALTAERFVPHPYAAEPGTRLYRPGDLGRAIPGGEMEVLGRGDTQVKVRGFRIEIGEIETRLLEHAAVRSAVVIVREDRPGDQQIVGYVVPRGEEEPGLAGLLAALRRALPAHMVPGALVTLDALPMTPNGKVDRDALPAPGAGNSTRGGASWAPPSGLVEELIAGIWAEVLGVERVGTRDDFFSLGGHSLLAAQVVSRVRSVLAVELPLRRLFEAPTVAELAEDVRALQRGAPGPPEPIEPAPRDEAGLPLSFAQQRLWLVDQIEPGGAAYNLPAAVRLEGDLSPARLERIFTAIAERHEALRTTFDVRGGLPVQVIAPEPRVALPVVDLAGLPQPEREPRALGLAAEEARRPFDLRRGPLLRLTLVRLAGREHLLLITLHHIISDGWSVGVLLREVAALDRSSSLPPLPVQYADFSVWQRRRLTGELLEGEVRWWREQLAGLPRVLALPTDRPRPAVRSLQGRTRALALPPELAAPVAALGRSQGGTLFMTLFAGFAAVLGHLSGQEDFAVGTAVAGRDQREVEGLIGCFVNTLVLRADLTGDPGFDRLLERIRGTVLGAFTHQQVPFDRLVEELAPARDASHAPLFQVGLALQNTPSEPPRLPGLTLAPVPVDSGTSKYDLLLSLDEGLAGWWEVSTALFDATTVDRLSGHLAAVLSGAVADPRRRLSELPVLTAAERHQLAVEWNDTEAGFPREPRGPFVHQRVAEQARRAPEAPAVVDGGRRLSYGELDARASALAARLRAAGVGPEVAVALCAERSLEMVVGMLAVLQAGGAWVPLDPSHPRERLELMISDSGAAVVLAQGSLAAMLPLDGPPLLLLDDPAAPAAPAPQIPLAAGNAAYLIYTSGSTGRPKGVVVTHGSLAHMVRWHHAWSGIAPGHRATQVAGPAFDAAVFEIWPCLTAGACLHIVDDETRVAPPRLIRWLADEGITLAWLPTPLAEAVLAGPWPTEMALQALHTAGDRLRRRPAPSFPGSLFNLYGPTEATVLATGQRVLAQGGPPPIGRPIADAQVHLLSPRLQPVPVGAPGEIAIGGAGLARGYLARPDLTAERFIPDPFAALRGEPGARLYRTGDLARWSADGALDFLGRTDHQVKVRGARIEPGEVEAALAAHPAVQACVVLAPEMASGDRRLVAWVTLDRTDRSDPSGLLSWLRGKLPDFMVPAELVVLDALPLTANGKIDRTALPVPSAEGSGRELAAPRTLAEETLCRIWAEVLGRGEVGIHDNFFALGGDSILGLQAMTRAREEGLALTGRDLFLHPTVADLAAAASAADGIPAELQPEEPEAGASEGFPEAELSEDDFDSLMTQIGRTRHEDMNPW